MENKYEVSCLVDKNSSKASLFVNEEGGNYQVRFEMGMLHIIAESENYFYALVELRKKLEFRHIKLLCKGCSRYVYPSPMLLSMGDATEAYELTLGKQALTKDLVNIFEPCKCDEYASVEEQYAYYEEWIRSKKDNG